MAGCSAAGNAQQNEAKIGCQVDSNKVCQDMMLHPLDTGSFTTSNQSYITQNSPATTWVMVPIKAPGGSEVDVQCQVNYGKKQVIYAYPTSSGTVSESDRQWMRQTGICTGGAAAAEQMPKIRGQE
ncbi:MAG: hypothetical protein ACREQR_14950 [Candidatus Binataceae bacterium]